MGGNTFELIMQELLEQKKHLEELAAENQELRRQIADLRTGRGIFVELLGTRLPLIEEVVAASSQGSSELQDNLIMQQTPISSSGTDAETPLPGKDFLYEEQQMRAAPFLEELLIDEFAQAATSPMTIWPGPATKQKQPDSRTKPLLQSKEEERAVLRRELMDSFLLE